MRKLKAGFKAVKMNATGGMDWISTLKDVKQVANNIRLLREEFGTDLDIGLDFHGRVHKAWLSDS